MSPLLAASTPLVAGAMAERDRRDRERESKEAQERAEQQEEQDRQARFREQMEREEASQAAAKKAQEEERASEAARVAEAAKREADRVEQERIRKEEESRLQKRCSDPAWIHPIASAHLCFHQRKRRETLREIAIEKRYSRIGGVEDLKKLYGLQERVRHEDEQIRAAGSWLPPGHGANCNDALIRRLTECLRTEEPDEYPSAKCSEDRYQEFQTVLRCGGDQ